MAQYVDRQSILNAALGEYAQYGFSLREPDDHVLELWFKDKRLAYLNQTTATVQVIRDSCQNYLEALSHWS